MKKSFYMLVFFLCLLVSVNLVWGQTGLTWKVANFETDALKLQGWKNLGWGPSLIEAKRATNADGGFMEIVIDFNADAAKKQVSLGNDNFNAKGVDDAGNPAAPEKMTYDVFIPADFPTLGDMKLFVQDHSGWSWQEDKVDQAALQKGAWNTLTFDIKKRMDANTWTLTTFNTVFSVGMELWGAAGESWKGSIYIDNITLHGVKRPPRVSELSWMVADFSLENLGTQNFADKKWGDAIKEVKRSTGVPAAGDAVLEVALDFTTGGKAALGRDEVGVIGWDESGKDQIAEYISMDIYFPADIPDFAWMGIFGQDRTNWIWQQEDVDLTKIVKGQWNTFIFDVAKRVETVNKYDISKKISYGFQFQPAVAGAWKGSIYVDNIKLYGIVEPVVKKESPKITKAATIDTMKDATTGKAISYNLIEWQDLQGDIGETYNVYASETGQITDVKAAGVFMIGKGVGRGEKRWSDRVTALDAHDVTRYYTVTTAYKDENGNSVEAPVINGVSNTGALTCKTVPCAEIPLVENFDFEIDGDLAEFRAVAATFTRSKLYNESTSGSASTGWTAGSKDLSFEMYLVLDKDNLYIGAEVTDDNPTFGAQSWQGDGFDVFGAFVELTDARAKYLGDNVPDNKEGGFRISYAPNTAAYESQLQKWGYSTWTNTEGVDHDVDKLDSAYVVEIKVPLATLAKEFGGNTLVPASGMWVPIKVDVNDNDGDQDPAYTGNLRTMQNHWGANPGNYQGWMRADGWTPVLITDKPLPTTAVDHSKGLLPFVTELKNNYPNPFNPVTRLQYQLEQAGQVKLVVYNALGHEIKTLVNENQAQGSHAVVWDGTNNRGAFVSSGVYFVRMTYNNYTRIQKMLLVK